MASNHSALSYSFFNELKKYNTTNYKTLYSANLSDIAFSQIDMYPPEILKAFSSVITRFLIFKEKHPELNAMDTRILYFQLKIDMIARFFANFPNPDIEDLRAFQRELKIYDKECECGDEYSS